MSYINSTYNHLRALQHWAAVSGAALSLDVTTMHLEVKHRNRYYELVPQFIALLNGRFAHLPTLSHEAIAFAGWRPYRPWRFDLSTEKLLFKQHLQSAGLRTPSFWADARSASSDFVLKRSRGSFGYEIAGPYRAGQPVKSESDASGSNQGTLFAEQFVKGRILKIWFWDSRPFFAHAHDYLLIAGDGRTGAAALAMIKRGIHGTDADRAVTTACLLYQGISADSVLMEGQEAWIDYRYGRSYAGGASPSASDNQLDALGESVRLQCSEVGALIAGELRRSLPAPVAYAIDGMLDDEGRIWWLEMNSNPVLPPEAYAEMFQDLFAWRKS